MTQQVGYLMTVIISPPGRGVEARIAIIALNL